MAKLLKKKEQEKINHLIEKFEENTFSELIIIIAKKSDPYPAATLRFAFGFSLLITLILSLFFEVRFNFLFPLASFITFFLGCLIGRLLFIQKWVLTENEKEREVTEKAYQTFFLNGPAKTEHRATSMIYFSILEQKFHFIVDKKISEKFSNDDLVKIVSIIQDEFSNLQYYEGFETAIETLERLILYYFPQKVLDAKPNELPNSIIFES